ncbi:hypothetical protein IJJ37_01235 [Candidatus Saccharibacteria bacterium]|nr:hypothetical protein [Candidatus Saccharibacteria bacterium]
MDNNNETTIKPSTIVLIALQVLFTILMIVSFSSVLAYEPVQLGVEVDDIEREIDGLTENGRNVIENSIYQMVVYNSNGGSVQKTGVVVREGSLTNVYLEEFNLHYVNFIADVPVIEQSYQVYYEWSDDELNQYISPDNSVSIMCLSNDLMIYKDFDCQEKNVDRKQVIVNKMLSRYNYTLPGHDSTKLLVTPEDWKNMRTKTKIEFLECDGQCACRVASSEEKNEVEAQLKEFVEGLGFRPQDIEYRFDNCQ